MVAALRQPDLLRFERNDGLGDLKPGEQTGLSHAREQHIWGPLLLMAVAPEPGYDHGVNSVGELPCADLVEAGADVPGERSVNNDAYHSVFLVPEPLEPWCLLPLALE